MLSLDFFAPAGLEMVDVRPPIRSPLSQSQFDAFANSGSSESYSDSVSPSELQSISPFYGSEEPFSSYDSPLGSLLDDFSTSSSETYSAPSSPLSPTLTVVAEAQLHPQTQGFSDHSPAYQPCALPALPAAAGGLMGIVEKVAVPRFAHTAELTRHILPQDVEVYQPQRQDDIESSIQPSTNACGKRGYSTRGLRFNKPEERIEAVESILRFYPAKIMFTAAMVSANPDLSLLAGVANPGSFRRKLAYWVKNDYNKVHPEAPLKVSSKTKSDLIFFAPLTPKKSRKQL